MTIRLPIASLGALALVLAVVQHGDSQIVSTGTSASAIITACGASSGQVLYNNAGSCAGEVPARLRYCITGVNFNSANTDNPVSIATLPITRYSIDSVRLTNASASISTATVGVFTGAGGTGQTIAASQAITVTATASDANNNAQSLTLTNANTEAYNDASLQVRVGTAQGSAATADVCLYVVPLT